MRKPFEVHLGVCTIWIYPRHCVLTTFPEGGHPRLCFPADDADTACRAYDLGYNGDLWVFTLDHELALTWLAQQQGQPYSRSLHHAAGLEDLSDDDDSAEQIRTWDYQRTLDKHEIRPWFRKVQKVLDFAA